MSKLSLHAVDQMYKNNSEDPILLLLELNFPDNTNYYLVNNTEDITSNGQLYSAFPFVFTMPDDDVDAPPQITITLSNVGLDFIDSFRGNIQNVTGRLKVVFASFPDFAEIDIQNMELKKISYDAKFINASFGYEDILTIKVPSETYNPTDFPGLYNV